MKLVLATILALAAAFGVSARQAALADPTGPIVQATCTGVSGPVYLQIHPAQSFNPLHAVGGSGGVLVPFTVVLNGQTVAQRAPGLVNTSALTGSLTTCSFTTPRGDFEVTGILTPATP